MNHIKDVFHKHGYKNEFINKAHIKAKRTFYGNNEKTDFLKENETLLVLPEKKLSSRKVLNKYLTKCNIKAVYKKYKLLKEIFPQEEK